jgi:DNA-directed RNA polymerase subunit RPC12/RpoP
MPKFAVVERGDRWWCEHCEKFYDDEEVEENGPIYECGSCGNQFPKSETGTHQCPQCQKFGSKLYDQSCPEGCTDELESVEVLIDTENGGAIFVPIEKVQDDG